VRDKDRPTIVLQPTWDQLDEITLGSVVSPEYQRAAREERIGDFATLALRMEHGPPSGSFMSASGTDRWCWPPVSVSAVGTGVRSGLFAGARWIRTIGYGDVSGRPPRARQRSSGSTPRSETSRLRSWEPTGPSTASTSHVYLAEFDYRFNRRYDLAAMMPRLCWASVRTTPMPYRLLKLAEVYS